MARQEECLYTKEHEWVHRDGDEIVVGITDFAQQELGDIVYVDMGDPGREVAAGEALGDIESVKAVAQVYAPVGGTVTAVNEDLADAPEKVNQDPFGEGWLVRMRPADPAELDALMDHEAYRRFLEEEGH